MADPTLSVENDVGTLVLQAPEDVWKKIKKELGVQTREQAASFVQADSKAKEIVLSILGLNTVVTKPATNRADSFLSATSKPRTFKQVANQTYDKPSSRKAGMKF